MAQILDGKIVAKNIREQAASDAASLKSQGKIVKLAIVLASDDPSSLSYVNSIAKTAEKLGIETSIDKPAQISQSSLESTIAKLANDENINGIMVQTPLPIEIDGKKLAGLIPLGKDVDGANPLSAGRLNQGLDCFAPATSQAIMEILKFYDVELSGKNSVIIGRSNIVGKPLAQLLLAQNSTVTICHSKTNAVVDFTKNADLLIAAIGRSKLISTEYVHKNLIIIDVGTNFDDNGKMTGDVDFDNVEPLVKAITPVPGGVGPVTTAVLLKQVCQAAKQSL